MSEETKVRKGIVLIIENEDDKYLLLRHKKNDLWGFVSGGIEEGESSTKTAVREAQEESGLELKEENIQDTGEKITFVSSRGPGEQQAFTTKIDSSPINIDGNEISEFGWFSYDEVITNLEPKPPLVELFRKVISKA